MGKNENLFLNAKLSRNVLNGSAVFWFLVTAIGQWIFVLYILGLYVMPGISGNIAPANEVLPHGYEDKNFFGNASLSAHLYVAAFISFVGPLQLAPKIRAKAPLFHRWVGRFYMVAALVMSLSGLYLILAGRELAGDRSQYVAIFINAILILVFGFFALKFAVEKNFARHRRWALRLFLAVSGVWLFRVGLMFWLVIHGKPVGFDPKSFSGPFLTCLAFLVYVFPAAILEIYLRAKDSKKPFFKVATAAWVFALAIMMTVGVFVAAMGMWLPRIGG